ncbi:hypothetical protein JOF28_000714 [Leucobacter exalbidus]|uniref:Uncharacterized protein n=1 Tax=Leucobacter exalbidus TaxID=662960 RepID=A0A940PRQ5_9MICO|nr:hypothetical protein [Leucobacter exalbidus]MBP1325482.1 hypothetical protein [Leucobacter exalbidus]
MAQDIGEQLILAEWLFVETVDDLRRRSTNPETRTRYELLGIAPLLRKLLTDGKALLNTIKTTRPEVPIEFHIRSWNEIEDKLAAAGLPRHFGNGGERIIGDPGGPAVGLEQFLKTDIGVAEGNDLSVKSVIRYYAHVEGGVHFGKPAEPGESTLNGMAPLLLGHSTGQIQILGSLGQIAVDAMEPLRQSILSEPTIHGLWHRKDDHGRFMNHWTTEYLQALRD